jgi:phospholipid/cholesterol/gamma-HCH transport system substrate-binding protein
MSTEAKVGTFVLAGLIFMSVAIFLLGDFTFEKRYTIYVTFQDVASLAKSAPVKLSGVDVGQVKEIVLDGNLAKVVASIRQGVDIYTDAEFEIGSTGIIGSKFLQVNQGHPDKGKIAPNSVIRGSDPVSVEKALTKALHSVEELLEGFNGNAKPGTLAHNMNATVANLRDITDNLNDLVESSKPHLEEALGRTDAITKKLDDLLAKSNQMMAGLASDKGAIGAMIHDPKVKEDVTTAIRDVKETAANVKDTFSRLNQFRIYWNYDWRYEHQIGAGHTDIGLRIEPREGRYYYVGGANLSNISDESRTTQDYAQPNRVDGLLGWQWQRWGGMLDVGVGVLRSAGGARVTVTPFYNHPIGSHFSFMAQGYDFTRNRTINGRRFTRPVWDFAVMARLNRVFGIGARVEDVNTIKRYQTWANITFEDKDIAYLFGIASFGAAGGKSRSKNK